MNIKQGYGLECQRQIVFFLIATLHDYNIYLFFAKDKVLSSNYNESIVKPITPKPFVISPNYCGHDKSS